VLPGPEIVFRPVHRNKSANFGKSLANFTTTSLQPSAKGSMKNDNINYFVSESLPLLKKGTSLDNFLRPLFCQFWQNSPRDFPVNFFSPGPF
jgi:hypothetical protein